ncbi:dynactin subunit 2 [Bacillus rossius redtenbacheri]|uniref:dynactin subunit 2 n=1 Tax=Bacillus rossius redtenbacheri TaxID=93214 RepID=UPI002FDECD05
MADPKYADLPGIAYDQPDVYETSELPEADQNTDFFEEESDSIERLHISAAEAFSKFKGKTLLADGVDFSATLNKSRRSGYDARSGDWELVGVGEKETPLQKLQRLQCEMNELAEEVAQLKVSEQATEKRSVALLAAEVEKTRKQLGQIRLEEVLGFEVIADLTDPQGTQLKKVLSLIDGLKEEGGAGAGQRPGSEAKAKAGDEGVVTYQLSYRPQHARLSQSARLAELEQKLHRLETVVGAAPDKLARLSKDMQNKSLAEVAQTLAAKLTLFDSAQIEAVEQRMTALALKMDSVAEKAAATSPPECSESTRKVCEMYDVVKKTEDVSQLLPQVLARMTALQSLHEQAVNVIKSFTQMEDLQQQICAGLQSNEVLLKNVQDTFSKNLLTIQKNLSSIDARVSAIK